MHAPLAEALRAPLPRRWRQVGRPSPRLRVIRALYEAQQRALALPAIAAMQLWYRAMGGSGPRGQPPEAQRELEHRYRALLDADFANAAHGVYPMSLLFSLPAARTLRALPEGLLDMVRVLGRSRRRGHDELPRDLDLSSYPEYYRRTFHWQTDGWLSERSARLYDPSVEVLFIGTADVMRRMVIPPVVEAAEGLARPRVLDLACGTGRLLLQLRAALPHAELHGLDLSPFYIGYARDLLGPSPDTTLHVENAESTSFTGASFDAVTCVFLFHELPRGVRRRVMAEAARLLRPGGVLVILDSAQLRDAGPLRATLEDFPRVFHEPYYRSYLIDDLEDALAASGLEVLYTEPWFVSKLVVARRPP